MPSFYIDKFGTEHQLTDCHGDLIFDVDERGHLAIIGSEDEGEECVVKALHAGEWKVAYTVVEGQTTEKVFPPHGVFFVELDMEEE
ncbi:hypothetical protein FOS14_10650 [Skermania sp. ID1734]|uniref:hypothetical protein n=1 Tax=Skermania sp. ID1734 TaxID=2597516 RepID=UPI00117DA294|nr:hypothetical protein [Skermania sp. ID1734]TSD99719.1 hypothetical protein FOS14_10650 [Skermania sp. ID1734]